MTIQVWRSKLDCQHVKARFQLVLTDTHAIILSELSNWTQLNLRHDLVSANQGAMDFGPMVQNCAAHDGQQRHGTYIEGLIR